MSTQPKPMPRPLTTTPDPDPESSPETKATRALAIKLSQSDLVPAHFRGKPNNVFLALGYSEHLGEPALVVMQALVVINGRAGWMAEFMVSRLNRSGRIKGPLRYRHEGTGKSLEVTAYAVDAADGLAVESTVTMAMAEADGWTRNAKYKSIPGRMLECRAASWFVRRYYPDVMAGYTTTAEELEDVREVEVESSRLAAINASNGAAPREAVEVEEREVEAEAEPDPEDDNAEPSEGEDSENPFAGWNP